MRKILAIILLLFCSMCGLVHAQEPVKEADNKPEAKAPAAAKSDLPFLIYYPGSASYEAGSRGGQVWDLGKFFGSKLRKAGTRFEGSVANSPEDAKTAIKENKVAFALVSPQFLFDNEKALDLRVIAATQHGSSLREEWVLVLPKSVGSLAEFKGRSLHCVRAEEESDYLQALLRPVRHEVEYKKAASVKAALASMRHAEKGAPEALLARSRYVKDESLKSKKHPLMRAWTSQPLSTSVVVAFGKRIDADDEKALKKLLTSMHSDEEGKKLIRYMSATKFVAANELQLNSERRALNLMREKRRAAQEAAKKKAAAKKAAAKGTEKDES